MGIAAKDIEALQVLMGELTKEECIQAADQVVDCLLKYGPALKRLMMAMVSGTVDMKIAMVEAFQLEGFSREEAVALTSYEWGRLQERLEKSQKRGL